MPCLPCASKSVVSSRLAVHSKNSQLPKGSQASISLGVAWQLMVHASCGCSRDATHVCRAARPDLWCALQAVSWCQAATSCQLAALRYVGKGGSRSLAHDSTEPHGTQVRCHHSQNTLQAAGVKVPGCLAVLVHRSGKGCSTGFPCHCQVRACSLPGRLFPSLRQLWLAV